eukprot:TRINITY_DN35000_c0_g3_i1.p1 TRINITY_DN35000_c0_g3~~TRINITY_DN35000_c0_g3_i1.p1  ORF type:complete len:370 (-),score=86.81 TRINITY_DN35000_c0_g3_i1:324-1433(-)
MGVMLKSGSPPAFLATTAGAVLGGIMAWHYMKKPPLKKPPGDLAEAFDTKDIAAWDEKRFNLVRKLQDASRNHGLVNLMVDKKDGKLVAVKQIPNEWIKGNHIEFMQEHPEEMELPWQDIGCVRFLEDVEYPYVCNLRGVYRDSEHTYFVSMFATEGDLFSMAMDDLPPCSERETQILPLVRQLIRSVQRLHEHEISHRDLSPENIVLAGRGRTPVVRLIDFGMASPLRYFRSGRVGKPSYQAPELHLEEECDAYLADVFAVGVTVYALAVKDYPWLSTKEGTCKRFQYFKDYGWHAYLKKSKLRGSTLKVGSCLSPRLSQFLDGLLQIDPAKRLTLGEAVDWSSGARKSVWDEPWLRDGPGLLEKQCS